MKYKIILADPAWKYSDRKLYRKDNSEQKAKFGIGAEGNYSAGTMDNESLARFKEDILSNEFLQFFFVNPTSFFCP